MPSSTSERLRSLNTTRNEPELWLQIVLSSSNIEDLIQAKQDASWGGDVHQLLSYEFIQLANQPEGPELIRNIISASKLSEYLEEVLYLLTTIPGQSYHVLFTLAQLDLEGSLSNIDSNEFELVLHWPRVESLGRFAIESEESKKLVRYESAQIMLLALREYLLSDN